MSINSYASLQLAIMDWLARPNDPLISGAVPDMIEIFEESARDRLKTRWNEAQATISFAPGEFTAPLPLDYWQARRIWYSDSNGNHDLIYQTPTNLDQMWALQGAQVAYTIEGLTLRTIGKAADVPVPLNIDYMQGLTSLSETVPTNWLLANYPSAYLFGTLTMAAAYIGDDPRLPLWQQGSEAAINRIQMADRKARFPQVLAIQTDVDNP
jgi:hypothetical protein